MSPAQGRKGAPEGNGLAGDGLDPVLAWAEEAVDFLGRRLTGRYAVDEFGYDRDLVEHVIAPLLRPLYRHWWRVETRGLADLAFTVPLVAPLARKSGNTLACGEDAERLLRGGELVGVWPEGYKGLGKPFRERYRLQRFGRGGFVGLALRHRVPIVPVAVVGGEEIYPMVGNLRRLARVLGFPYLPVTPTFPLLGPLGLVPLPSKWLIEFCPPLDTSAFPPDAADDPMVVFDLTDQVRDTIQQALNRNLAERDGVFR